MDVCLRVLKESNKSRFDSCSRQEQCIDYIPLSPFGIVPCTFSRQPCSKQLCTLSLILIQPVPGSQILQWEHIKTSKAKTRRARLGKGRGGGVKNGRAPARFSHFLLLNDFPPTSRSLEQANFNRLGANMRDYIDRRVTPPKRVTSHTWGPPRPSKQALNRNRILLQPFYTFHSYNKMLCLNCPFLLLSK